ncbi:MAG: CIA30 family protein [Candidatus Aureabacteria bacterium]|nr:CIA30 family protein [Candidatus Auribacterota bacterium]
MKPLNKTLIGVIIIYLALTSLYCGKYNKFSKNTKEDTPITVLSGNKLLIDDLEGNILTDSGYGNRAELSVSFILKKDCSEDIHTGNQAIKLTYDKTYGGYMYCARGFGLTPSVKIPQEKLIWTVKPDEIDFNKYNAFGFYIKGDNTGNTIAVDLFDKDKEVFRYMITDDSKSWKEIVIPFNKFISRNDYQSNSSKSNKKIDFPILTYQFEPFGGKGKEIKGNIIIDTVHFDITEL